MRPVQNHRILREKPPGGMHQSNSGVASGFLVPIHVNNPASDANIPKSNNPGNHIVLPKIDNNHEKDATIPLQKRIKELEKENYRLQHHVQQAEQSLRNYRELMSNKKNSPATSEINVTSISPIKQPTSNLINEEQNRELRVKLEQTEKEKRDLTKTITETQHILKTTKDSLSTTTATLQKKINSLEQDIVAKNEEIQTLKNRSPAKTDLSSIPEMLKKIKGIKTELSSFKFSAQRDILTLCDRQTEDTKDILDQARGKLVLLTDHLSKKDQELKNQQTHYINLINNIERDKKVQSELLENLQQEIERLRSNTNLIIETPKEIQRSISTNDMCNSPLIKWRDLESKTQDDETLINRQQDRLDSIATELSDARETIVKQREQLLSIYKAIEGLEEVHAAEVKAIKHLGHVKELVRVAKEREDSLDKDRLNMEVKYMKEVQNVLLFSINTSESSLNEALPHVVVKLVEGRNKRLKLIERSFQTKLKDIELRSADTCAVSTSHLEQFQKKATENQKNAEIMTKEAVEKVKTLLKP